MRGAHTGLDALERAQAAGFPIGDVVAEAARTVARVPLGEAAIALDVVVFDRTGGLVGRAGP